jgi:hypothetical protein
MVIPELKSIISPDLEYGKFPEDIEDCSVFIQLTIGPKENAGEEIFSFTAVTTKYISNNFKSSWGRGYLILKEFSWQEIEQRIDKFLNLCWADDWNGVINKLKNELHWEFENYKE